MFTPIPPGYPTPTISPIIPKGPRDWSITDTLSPKPTFPTYQLTPIPDNSGEDWGWVILVVILCNFVVWMIMMYIFHQHRKSIKSLGVSLEVINKRIDYAMGINEMKNNPQRTMGESAALYNALHNASRPDRIWKVKLERFIREYPVTIGAGSVFFLAIVLVVVLFFLGG